MKLPIPLLLYLVSLGLFGLAGWTVYEMLPLWKDSARQKATTDGQNEAIEHLQQGKGRGPVLDWNYGGHPDWWAALKRVNFVGKQPPPPKPVGGPDEAPKAPVVELRPIGDIIELVSLVHDGEANGRGGNTYVIVRYKPGADVKPPEWYIRENMTGPAAASPPGRDTTPPASATRPRPGNRGSQPPASQPSGSGPSKPPGTSSQIPTSMAGRDIMQKVWVVDDGDPRHGNRLWPTFDNIKLVGVSPEAQIAYFVRDLPPPKEGEPAPEAKEESLMKTNMHISAELLEELRSLQGRAAPTAGSGTAAQTVNPGNAWIDLPETKVVNGVTQVSRRDEERFSNPDELLAQIHVDTYAGKSMKGLIVRNVDANLAKTLGIAAGEVLIEINGRGVRSRSEALEIGKGDYRRGVRTFVTKWLANGAVIERTYQAPDR